MDVQTFSCSLIGRCANVNTSCLSLIGEIASIQTDVSGKPTGVDHGCTVRKPRCVCR